VSSAKGRDREKLFSDWMKMRDFEGLTDKKGTAGEQLIYFEYHEGKDQFRGIFSKAVDFEDWWFTSSFGEKEMLEEVTSQKARGYEPLFIVREGNFYSMIFVKPDKLAAGRKALEALGIEAPEVK